MQCDYLLEFVTMVHEGSMTKTATKLGLSQSSLSRHLKTLETEFGMQLFYRGAHEVKLTSDGHAIYSKACGLLDIVEDIDSYVSYRQKEATPAVYGLSDYPGLVHLLFEAYAQSGRKDALRVLPAGSLNAPSPCEALESREISLWVTYSNDRLLSKSVSEGLCIVDLFHPCMIAIVEPSNPLAAKKSLVAADLDGQQFDKSESSYMDASTSWRATKELFDEKGIRYRAVTGAFEHENDWYVSFGPRILPMPEGNRSIDLLRSFGKVAVPVEDLAYTFVGVYRKDDHLIERLIEKCVEAQKAQEEYRTAAV